MLGLVIINAGSGSGQSDLITTLAPYVVVVLSIFGAFATTILTSRQSHAAWLRESRRHAYGTLVDCLGVMWERLQIAAHAADRNDPDAAMRVAELDAAQVAADRAVTAVKILGPPDLVAAGSAYFQSQRKARQVLTSTALKQQHPHVRQAHDDFVRAARKALKGDEKAVRTLRHRRQRAPSPSSGA